MLAVGTIFLWVKFIVFLRGFEHFSWLIVCFKKFCSDLWPLFFIVLTVIYASTMALSILAGTIDDKYVDSNDDENTIDDTMDHLRTDGVTAYSIHQSRSFAIASYTVCVLMHVPPTPG